VRATPDAPALVKHSGRILFQLFRPIVWLAGATGAPRADSVLLIRCRFINLRLAAAIESGGVRQVIEVDADLDCRERVAILAEGLLKELSLDKVRSMGRHSARTGGGPAAPLPGGPLSFIRAGRSGCQSNLEAAVGFCSWARPCALRDRG
jgi:hypothetical protein